MQDIPRVAPVAATAGDTLQWYQSALDNTSADGWALTVSLTGAQKVDAAVTIVDGQFLVTFSATVLGSIPAGIYSWVARATLAGVVQTVARGVISIAADPAALSGDTRSWDERMYDAIKLVISGRIPADVEKYTIGTRSIDKMPSAELLTWLAHFERRVLMLRTGGKLPKVDVTFRSDAPFDSAFGLAMWQ